MKTLYEALYAAPGKHDSTIDIAADDDKKAIHRAEFAPHLPADYKLVRMNVKDGRVVFEDRRPEG